MKNLICVSILLTASIGYSQDKVLVKSSEPVKEIFVKMPLNNVKVISSKAVVKNDIVLQKQSIPTENRMVNYIGIPKTTYVEPVAVVKKEVLLKIKK